MGYSIDPLSANCYPGTQILINKFNIRDEEKLNEVEGVITSARYAEWENAPKMASFDFSHYKAIHHYLFSDIYEWAGKIREVNISKKGTRFVNAENIEQQAGLIFSYLKSRNYFLNMPRETFVDEITDFYCNTNALHPFREGNGRTQRAFLAQLVRNDGYQINWSEIDADLLMIATIQSAQGVNDLLREFLNNAIKPLKR